MNIYFNNKLIFENIEKENIESRINEYIEKETNKYKDIYEKTKRLIKTIKSIRPKKMMESKEDYELFLKNEHLEVLETLLYIGKTYFEDSFLSIYFKDSLHEIVGIIYKDEKNETQNMTLTPLLLEIPLRIPTKKDFEVKEDI